MLCGFAPGSADAGHAQDGMTERRVTLHLVAIPAVNVADNMQLTADDKPASAAG